MADREFHLAIASPTCQIWHRHVPVQRQMHLGFIKPGNSDTP